MCNLWGNSLILCRNRLTHCLWKNFCIWILEMHYSMFLKSWLWFCPFGLRKFYVLPILIQKSWLLMTHWNLLKKLFWTHCLWKNLVWMILPMPYMCYLCWFRTFASFSHITVALGNKLTLDLSRYIWKSLAEETSCCNFFPDC